MKHGAIFATNPNTAFAASPKDTSNLMALVGTAPLIVKLLESTQGKGVVLAETKKAAESVIDAFRGLKANFLVQDFVKEAAGEDIRCLVVAGKVVASMKRTGAEGDRADGGCSVQAPACGSCFLFIYSHLLRTSDSFTCGWRRKWRAF